MCVIHIVYDNLLQSVSSAQNPQGNAKNANQYKHKNNNNNNVILLADKDIKCFEVLLFKHTKYAGDGTEFFFLFRIIPLAGN